MGRPLPARCVLLHRWTTPNEGEEDIDPCKPTVYRYVC
jgi:hypothetical protein